LDETKVTSEVFEKFIPYIKSIVGGELAGMTKQLAEAREEAMERLSENARQAGANAIIAMRFDSNELGGIYQEILAYGTAVVIEPLN
jgi:uncharacterized protein YbjQ (UPF0145 family)